MTLLEAQHVSVVRSGAPPLRFPSLHVGKGDKILLLGPSGSGKTTFLSVIAGLLRPAEGNVALSADMAGIKTDTILLRGRLQLVEKDPENSTFYRLLDAREVKVAK